MKTYLVWALGIALLMPGVTPAVESITVRSGQSGGIPGTSGSPDDTVTYNPWGNPGGLPVLGTAFTASDFAATAGGSSAVVISPSGAWMGGAVAPLSDSLARWINFGNSFGQGTSGSALYSVPFTIQSSSFSQVLLSIEGGVDDSLGDAYGGGPNFEGLYVNGTSVPSSLTSIAYDIGTFNFLAPSSHVVDITAYVSPGLNHFYLYQRDVGFSVAGIIFSATISVVPEPTSAVMLVLLVTATLAGHRTRR